MSARPVIALDFDGVLNPLTPESPGPGWIQHDIHVAAEHVPNTGFVRRDPDGSVSTPVWLNPETGEWITSLRARADVYWATTWENAANIYIAPLLGIDPLPLAADSAVMGPKFSMSSAGWKASSLRENIPDGIPLIWVDDQSHHYTTPEPMSDAERAKTAARFKMTLEEFDRDFEEDRWRGGPTLVLTPRARVGITAEDRARIDAFLNEHAASA